MITLESSFLVYPLLMKELREFLVELETERAEELRLKLVQCPSWPPPVMILP